MLATSLKVCCNPEKCRYNALQGKQLSKRELSTLTRSTHAQAELSCSIAFVWTSRTKQDNRLCEKLSLSLACKLANKKALSVDAFPVLKHRRKLGWKKDNTVK